MEDEKEVERKGRERKKNTEARDREINRSIKVERDTSKEKSSEIIQVEGGKYKRRH